MSSIPSFAKTISSAPLLNKPRFIFELSKDSQNRFIELETIIFPYVLLELVEQVAPEIWEIKTKEYPSSSQLYIDSKFFNPIPIPLEREIELPSREEVVETMKKLEGIRYFWGGSYPYGIPNILKFYPHIQDRDDLSDLICQGIDCSGLLYFASNGWTPRNTSQLIHFGTKICESSLSSEELQTILKPLDIIVWKGHVIIAVSHDTVIESRIDKGVVFSPLKKRFPEVQKLAKEQNQELFIRRWYP